jgi:small GTP-binding protein
MLNKFVDGFLVGLKKANPNASEQQIKGVVNELKRRIQDEPPPRIAIVGEAGVGKSTTLNSLFNAGVPVSDTRACTKDDIELTIDLGKSPKENRRIIVYDMPGLGESIQADAENIKVYERILPQVDVFVWVLDGQNRAIRSVQERLRDDIYPRIPDSISKLVIAINKVDLIAPGQAAWNRAFNVPTEKQQQNITGREQDIQEKIREVLPAWNGQSVAYSAAMRYRLPSLFRAMLEAVPEERRWVLGEQMDIASFEELVDKNVLKAIRQDSKLFSDNSQRGQKSNNLEWE